MNACMEKTETRHMLKETEMKKIQDCMPYVFPSIVFNHYVFLAAQRHLRDLVSKRYFSTNCIHSTRLRTTIKAGIVLSTFSIFFRETTFLESNAGGPPTGGSHRAGLVVSKKKEEGKGKRREKEKNNTY